MAGRDVFPLLREHEIYFDEDKPLQFCARCSVFENDERVGKQAVWWRTASHTFLRENENEVVNLEETDDRNEFNEEL